MEARAIESQKTLVSHLKNCACQLKESPSEMWGRSFWLSTDKNLEKLKRPIVLLKECFENLSL